MIKYYLISEDDYKYIYILSYIEFVFYTLYIPLLFFHQLQYHHSQYRQLKMYYYILMERKNSAKLMKNIEVVLSIVHNIQEKMT